MIRINLLKGSAKPQHWGPPITKKILIAGVVIVGVVVVMGGIMLLAPRMVATLAPASASSQVEKTIPHTITPPTLLDQRIVEEVVGDVTRERDRLRQDGLLRLSYDQLSEAEKINFEWLFAKEACDFLSRVIPENIGLHRVEIENFTTIYGVGLSSSRSQVTQLFSALKDEKVNVLSPPISFIKDNGDGGFRFGFGCEVQWGLSLSDSMVDLSLSRLPPRGALESTVAACARLARKSGIVDRRTPVRIDAMKTALGRRFTYRWQATSSFAALADFLNHLVDARLPCAFQSLKLTAAPGGKILIDAVVIFTTRD